MAITLLVWIWLWTLFAQLPLQVVATEGQPNSTSSADHDTVIADATVTIKRACGTHSPSPENKNHTEAMLASHYAQREIALKPAAILNNVRALRSVAINVYFFIIQTTTGNGDVSDTSISRQIAVMNAAYASTPFKFVLAGTTRVKNSNWFNLATTSSSAEYQMKSQLRKGTAATLNIYTVNTSLLGWATFPDWYRSDPKGDGVVLYYRSLPGVTNWKYGLGITAVHEVGHWLGLYHTFEGGCSGSGDFVSDTPAEKAPNFGCPVGKDSCPFSTGKDPINNYMDYTDDACMNKFSALQIARMDSLHLMYRS